jgi:hypothetical protein
MFHKVLFWTVTLRCLSAAHSRLVASTAVRLFKRARLTARARESLAGSFGLTHLGLFQQSLPPCWSRRSVAQYLCGHRARRIMRVEHAVSQGSNWTRSERARRCTHRRDPHKSAPPSGAGGRGGSQTVPRNARGRQTCARSTGRPQPLWTGREHPARLRQGTRVSRPAPADVRDAHPRRTDAAPSGDLRCARHRQPDDVSSVKE